MGYSGAGGKLIHKKARSKKSRDTVPLINLWLKPLTPIQTVKEAHAVLPPPPPPFGSKRKINALHDRCR